MDENERNVEVHHDVRTPGWVWPVVGILGLVAIAGLGLAWYDASQLNTVQQTVGAQFKTEQQNFAQQVSTLEQRESQAEAANTGLASDLGVVTKRLGVTQANLVKARKDASDEADQVRSDAEQKVADLNNNVNTALATKASADDLNATNGTVTGVKTDLEGTKNDLKMARSEMGTLIAKNHDEIDELRRLGERDYVEFTIDGRNKPQKVGSISVDLKGVNQKMNQFTVDLVINDVRTEDKSHSVNQPIFFYTNGDRRAGELVVNSVGKDKITGYISMPKSGTSTAAASNSGD